METDTIIVRKIQNAINSKSALAHRSIAASISDDVITLTGNVENYIEKKMAECAAKKVAGSRIIANLLHVTFADYSRDNELKWKALSLLSNSEPSRLSDASVSVIKGWITIRGETENDGLKSMFREKMLAIGATGVINLIRILE